MPKCVIEDSWPVAWHTFSTRNYCFLILVTSVFATMTVQLPRAGTVAFIDKSRFSPPTTYLYVSRIVMCALFDRADNNDWLN